MPIAVRLATLSDADEIASLSHRTIERGLPWRWTPNRVAKAIAATDTNVVVACIARAVIGVGIMQYGDDDAHLLLFGIDAPDRRRGLGSQLLRWLEAVAIESGASMIRLEARSDNAAAIAFYERHGFRLEGVVLGMYHGAEDGVRLVKRLRPSDDRP